MIQLVVQPVAINSIMNGTLMLGMIFTVEENSNMILIIFHYTNMEQRLFTTLLKCQYSPRWWRILTVLVKLEMTILDHQLVLLNIYIQNIKNQYLALQEKISWLGRTFTTHVITLFQALVWIEILWPLKKMKELPQHYLDMHGNLRLQKALKNHKLDLRMLTITLTLILMKT